MNHYSSIKNCKNRIVKNTNKRYSNFCQTHFTCGDYQQFYQSRCYKQMENIENKYNNNPINWEKYSNIDDLAVENTFKYIFDKFKKGIFLKIHNNEVSVFLPFSNYNYINQFPDIHYTEKWPNLYNLCKYVTEKSGYKYNEKFVNKFTDQWYANNSLIRYEYPINEGDSGCHQIIDMFEKLCKNRKLPDIELFINKRDFPILKKNSTEPYDSIYGKDCNLQSHNYDKYCPILSMNGNENFADIIIPTWEDWSRVSNQEDDIFFPKPCKNYKFDFSTPWQDKKEIAVFRGSSTGISSDIELNRRLKLCRLKNELLDCGLTSYNLRPRFFRKDDKLYLSTIDVDDLNCDIVDTLTPQQQSKYKYIINIEGHSIAYRLSLELSMGSVILLVDCENKLWYSDKLQPYIHYVPVKNDLSDIITQIEWCKANDDKCRRIAENAKKFYNDYLTKDKIFDYLQDKLYQIKDITKTYKYVRHEKILSNIINENEKLTNTFTYENFEFIQKFKSKHTNIFISSDNKIIKKISDSDDLFHSAYIGLNHINKLNSNNFCKTLGINKNTLFLENIDGTPFNLWIKNKFSINSYFKIIKTILQSLEIAQNSCQFIHFDLYPWNIMIKHDNTPVIIDYGKSYVKNHLVLEMITDCENRFHDVLTIMMSSLNDILKYRKLTSYEIRTLIRFANLIGNRNYTKNKYFKNLVELKHFIYSEKKFDRMLYSNKYDLSNLTPKFIYEKL